ncbi:MAG: thymidine phosphorylase [Nitrospirota bacterium]
MRAVDIIRKKRDGGKLTKNELSFFIDGYLRNEVPDYQMSSFLMAVYFSGMNDEETVALTEVMLSSGVVLDLKDIKSIKIGKHSTGGVGDKVSIILAPVVAAAGIKVPKISGRGLGHTGGTIDKLASIPGLRTNIPLSKFRENLETIGFSIMEQTEEMAPADKELYALRDATATIESISLVASSIMSKKLSEGTDGLVLDVKTGSGAFMKNLEDARKLAQLMVKIGNSEGVRTVALITDMNEPLGKAVGNSLEIKECILGLRGRCEPDLMEIVLTLSAWMLYLADRISEDMETQMLNGHLLKRYKDEVVGYINNGNALKKFIEFVDAQHGNPEAVFNLSLLPSAKHIKPVKAPRDGFITRLDAWAVGQASVLLGAGRETMVDDIDHAAGIILNRKSGDHVTEGDAIAVLHTNDDSRIKEAEEIFLSGVEIGDRAPAPRKLIREIVF